MMAGLSSVWRLQGGYYLHQQSGGFPILWFFLYPHPTCPATNFIHMSNSETGGGKKRIKHYLLLVTTNAFRSYDRCLQIEEGKVLFWDRVFCSPLSSTYWGWTIFLRVPRESLVIDVPEVRKVVAGSIVGFGVPQNCTKYHLLFLWLHVIRPHFTQCMHYPFSFVFLNKEKKNVKSDGSTCLLSGSDHARGHFFFLWKCTYYSMFQLLQNTHTHTQN